MFQERTLCRNGKIINMSFGNYENTGQAELLKAFEYAAEKGVLIVHAAENDSLNINKIIHSPSRKGGSKKLLILGLKLKSNFNYLFK